MLFRSQWLDRLDATGRWALLKFLSGAPRVGVSARLAKQAVADAFGVRISAVTLVTGVTSRDKVVDVAGDTSALQQRLEELRAS